MLFRSKAHTGPLPEGVLGATNYKKAQSDWFDQLRAQGFDSWVPEGQNVAVILKDPTAIKSAIGNVGTFDPANADIGKAEGGAAEHPLTQDVYHGTQHDFPAFREGLKNRAEYMPSLMLGTHVARDPAIASNEYFTQRDPDKGGHVMPLKTYPDEKFFEIPQKKPNGMLEHDDYAVEKAVKLHAFQKRPDVLALALMQDENISFEKAMEGAEKLVRGESWTTPRQVEFKDLHDLVYSGFSPHFPSPAARVHAVRSFRDHLIKQGYAGVKYINTADDETSGARDKVCYIAFDKPTKEGYYPLRGRFAAMNPADKADPDLMKSEGGMVEKADGGGIDKDPLRPKGEWSMVHSKSPWGGEWRKFPFVKNPTADDIHRLMDMEGENVVRGIHNDVNGEMYAFPGSLLHEQGITLTNMKAGQHGTITRTHIERSKGKLYSNDKHTMARLHRVDGGPIDAYHGSPHDFDKFDFSKIGTGEGAQAFGHGLYLAGNPDVARNYRQHLAGTKAGLRHNGKPLPFTWAGGRGPENDMLQRLAKDYGLTYADEGRTMLEEDEQRQAAHLAFTMTSVHKPPEVHRRLAKLRDKLSNGRLEYVPPGRLYDVRLHADPESLLDLDVPLGDQSARVKKALDRKSTRLNSSH